jgi:hypothetical protein
MACPIVRKFMPLASAANNKALPITNAISGFTQRIKTLKQMVAASFTRGSRL